MIWLKLRIRVFRLLQLPKPGNRRKGGLLGAVGWSEVEEKGKSERVVVDDAADNADEGKEERFGHL